MIDPLYFILAKLYAKKYGQCKIGDPTYSSSSISLGSQYSLSLGKRTVYSNNTVFDQDITLERKSIVVIAYSIICTNPYIGAYLYRNGERVGVNSYSYKLGKDANNYDVYFLSFVAVETLDPDTYNYEARSGGYGYIYGGVMRIIIIPIE